MKYGPPKVVIYDSAKCVTANKLKHFIETTFKEIFPYFHMRNCKAECILGTRKLDVKVFVLRPGVPWDVSFRQVVHLYRYTNIYGGRSKL